MLHFLVCQLDIWRFYAKKVFANLSLNRINHDRDPFTWRYFFKMNMYLRLSGVKLSREDNLNRYIESLHVHVSFLRNWPKKNNKKPNKLLFKFRLKWSWSYAFYIDPMISRFKVLNMFENLITISYTYIYFFII